MTDRRPLPVIHRQTLHMVADNAEPLALAVGLPPISAELAEMERRDAQLRLGRIAALVPLIHDQADFLSALFTRVQKDQAEANGMPVHEIDWQPVHQVIFSQLNSTTMASVALLVDLGVLHLDPEWVTPSEQTEEQEP